MHDRSKTVGAQASAAIFVAAALLTCACKFTAPPEMLPQNTSSVQRVAPPLALVDDFNEPESRFPLPPRQANAMSGHEFLNKTATMTGDERERVIEKEILAGNVPSFLRALRPIYLEGLDERGSIIAVTVWVMADYAAIGSDDDFVRAPMNLYTATRIARRLGLGLPTPRIVKQIAKQATKHLMPRPLPPGPAMGTNTYIALHNQMIEEEIGTHLHGEIIAGHKKDVVISMRALERPGRLIIYGWHRPDGKAIQQISDVHDAKYADYSHGVRFISRVLEVNGRPMAIDAALADAQLAPIISSEGRFTAYSELMNPANLEPQKLTEVDLERPQN